MIKPVPYQLPTLQTETDSIVNPLIASITASAYGVDPIAAAILSATANVQATSPVVPKAGNIISLNPIETAPVVTTPIKTGVTNSLLQDLVNVNPRPTSSTIALTKPITVTTAVYDVVNVLPGANVYINNVATAISADVNGKVVLPNVQPSDLIKFTYIGYADQVFRADEVPAKVVLITTDKMIENINVKPSTTKKSNWWKFLLATAVTVGVVKAVSKDKKPKTTKNAKI